MAQRDYSGAQWLSPGLARVTLSLVLSSVSSEEIPIDEWLNGYSPSIYQTLNLASGFTAVPVPDVTNMRGVFIAMPRGNTQTWTMKGITGDTGLEQHPNGFFCTSFDGTAPATIGVTTGGVIPGALFYWW